MAKTKYDFSGYATKNNIKCSDGRTIQKDAFKHNDGQIVPLVWQHLHNEPENVLGHAVLENREDGVYTYGKFNDTPAGKNAKELVKHGDITNLSIYANSLKQTGSDVIHGVIREVSLVLAGANPGATIDNLNFAHSDGSVTCADDEAIIHTGMKFSSDEIMHGSEESPKGDDSSKKATTLEEFLALAGIPMAHAEGKEKSVEEIFNSLNDDQKSVVYGMIGIALSGESSVEHSNLDDKGELIMKTNVFDKTNQNGTDKKTLSHSQLEAIMVDAKACGSFKEAFLAHATEYGIENIDLLFPDAKMVSDSPDFVKRRTEWVAGVISGTKHSPFARIKSMSADITQDTARAKGYIKGNMKKEEFFALARRITTPVTIYKKQKLDRDDIIDITDLDVVAWLKAEMRVMLDEEIARAVLIGDGREADDEDRIKDPSSLADGAGIRSIAHDNTFYAHQATVAANVAGNALVEAIIRSRVNYKGSGNPTMYTTENILTDMLLIKDKMGRRLYATQAELESALRVSKIVTVEVMENQKTAQGDLLAILVNMGDYTLGANKGGAVSMFDDFDIDYNQYKYLIETRLSGALTKPKSALVVSRVAGTKATPTAPTFAANKITIPTVTGVEYTIADVVVTEDVTITEDTTVEARPATAYYFDSNITVEWTFEYVAG